MSSNDQWHAAKRDLAVHDALGAFPRIGLARSSSMPRWFPWLVFVGILAVLVVYGGYALQQDERFQQCYSRQVFSQASPMQVMETCQREAGRP